MQVYKDLRILTARPTPDEERLAPHRLFGAIDGAVNFSVGRWARAAGEVLAEIGEEPVIFVGGTGLYFRALTDGLSDIPPVPEAVRAAVRSKAEGRATAELHAELQGARSRDCRAPQPKRPAAHLARARGHGFDRTPARLVPRRPSGAGAGRGANGRASTSRPIGRSSASASTRGSTPCSPAARSTKSRRLMQRRLDPALPVMRAHGVPHLIAHLEGRLTLDEAAKRSKLDTRHYAKRQFTWARHQLSGFKWVAPEEAVGEGARALGGMGGVGGARAG